MLSDFYLLVKNSWLRIGDIVSLLEPLGPSEKANFLEADFWPENNFPVAHNPAGPGTG
jgi:hypothetical protein